MCISLCCFSITLTVPTDHHSFNSSSQISNKNMRDKPNGDIKLQDSIHYTLRKYSQNIFSRIFSGENRIERSRILQVRIERITFSSLNIHNLYLLFFIL